MCAWYTSLGSSSDAHRMEPILPTPALFTSRWPYLVAFTIQIGPDQASKNRWFEILSGAHATIFFTTGSKPVRSSKAGTSKLSFFPGEVQKLLIFPNGSNPSTGSIMTTALAKLLPQLLLPNSRPSWVLALPYEKAW